MKRYLVIITIIAVLAGQAQVQAMSWFSSKTPEQTAADEARRRGYEAELKAQAYEGSRRQKKEELRAQAYSKGVEAAKEKVCFDNGYKAALEDIVSGKQPADPTYSTSKPCYTKGYTAGKQTVTQAAVQQAQQKLNPAQSGGCVIQ